MIRSIGALSRTRSGPRAGGLARALGRIALAAFILLPAVGADSLELTDGLLRLTLHENTARFTLHLRAGSAWLPLFYADDPRTSGIDVLEGNRTYRMGDSGAFRQTAEQTERGARYIWTSATLRVVQEFRFTRGIGSSVTGAVEMRITVANLGEQAVEAGVRVLLDTYLGERRGIHFETASGEQITRERSFVPSASDRYLVSSAEPGSPVGFQLMLAEAGVTSAEEVVVANWKRLADSRWNYEANPSRNFNLLPFSVNDSAVLFRYPTMLLPRGSEYTVVLRMGNLSPGGYLDPATAAAVPAERAALIARLSELLDRINELIAATEVDPSEVERLREELETVSRTLRGP